MAKITAIIKSDYTDKNNESRVVLQYSHLYKTWKYNTGIRVDPSYAQTIYDDDLEIWKLTGTRKLKPSERKKVTEANEALRQIYMNLTRTILDLKTRSSSLAPSCVSRNSLKRRYSELTTGTNQR